MSTTLPHGIIQINEGNISWYGDITANWQLIDGKIGIYDAAVASIPAPANNGTLTINYGGTTLAMFGADDAGNVTADIPAPGDGTLTVTRGGSTLGSFSANQATPETIDIPAPGDGTLTIQLNGTDVQTFTANQSGNVTANIVTPSVNDGTITVTYGGSTLGTFTTNQAANGTIAIPAPGDGTLTVTQGGSTLGSFSANQATPETVDIPAPGDGTLTVTQGGSTLGSFSANQAADDTIAIPAPGAGVLTVTVDGITAGTFSANQATNETISIEVALPVGSYIQFAGSQAPAGFLVCNGGEISRTTYSALFAVIGTTYGSGDGSTTFNLPNLTDRFLQGSSTSGTVKNAGLPNITGYTSSFRSPVLMGNGGEAFNLTEGAGVTGLTLGSGDNDPYYVITFDASRSNSTYGNSTTVQPPALTCLICIKY